MIDKVIEVWDIVIKALEANWWVMFIIMGLAWFIAWCCGKAAKDPYFNDDMDNMQDYAEFIDTVEKDKPDIMKDQAS